VSVASPPRRAGTAPAAPRSSAQWNPYSLRTPDASSQAVMTRRGWWLVALNFLLPGAAQSLAGHRRLGRIGIASTLGIVYGLGRTQDEESLSLRDSMQQDKHPDGTSIYTPLTGLSLMVFFVLAMQCMSTLAAVKRETRSWRWPLFQIGYMTALAVAASLLVYQGGQLLGFT